MTRRWRKGTLGVLLGLLCSCASSNDRGRVLYGEGRLIEAAEVFEHNEAQLVSYGSRERARYGLYRGLTLLQLGDMDGAGHWLYFARQSEAAAPGSLRGPDVLALNDGWKRLDEARAHEPASPNRLKGALARSGSAGAAMGPDVESPDDKSGPTAGPGQRAVSTSPNP